MTCQLGSICLGSIMVAVLNAVRVMVSAMNNDKCSCISCLVLCCLRCIEWMIEYFNKYAYAHCGVLFDSLSLSLYPSFSL